MEQTQHKQHTQHNVPPKWRNMCCVGQCVAGCAPGVVRSKSRVQSSQLPWALQQNTRGKPNSDNTKQRSNALSQVRGKSKLAPSWLCVLGHSSHQVLSLFSPLSLASSLCRPRMYDCRADLLAQC